MLDGGQQADVAWIFRTPWQGRGYATEAAIALIRWLEMDGVRSITAHVHPQHTASAKVAERAESRAHGRGRGGEVI